MKNIKITEREKRLICTTLAILGVMLIGSGLIMNSSNRTIIERKYNLSVNQQKVAESKTNEIKLKDIILEINTPLSVNIKDYLENVGELEQSVIKALKLDTSTVNIIEAGSYTYTVSFKKKKYNGTITIKEKQLPKANITLKNIRLEKNSALPVELSTYIVENLTEEVKQNIILDLHEVNTTQVGDYQYTVTYDGKMYTGTISIYEQHTTVITPNDPPKEEETPKEEPPKEETPSNNQEQ